MSLKEVWMGMRCRCSNEGGVAFKHYGGRGIVVCERWESFDAFASDMGERPSRDHSLDRIDNDGPYSPENCRWATMAEQTRNKRSNVFLTLNGETLIVADWAARTGIPHWTIRRRKRAGWTDERSLTEYPLGINGSRLLGGKGGRGGAAERVGLLHDLVRATGGRP